MQATVKAPTEKWFDDKMFEQSRPSKLSFLKTFRGCEVSTSTRCREHARLGRLAHYVIRSLHKRDRYHSRKTGVIREHVAVHRDRAETAVISRHFAGSVHAPLTVKKNNL